MARKSWNCRMERSKVFLFPLCHVAISKHAICQIEAWWPAKSITCFWMSLKTSRIPVLIWPPLHSHSVFPPVHQAHLFSTFSLYQTVVEHSAKATLPFYRLCPCSRTLPDFCPFPACLSVHVFQPVACFWTWLSVVFFFFLDVLLKFLKRAEPLV